MHASENAACVNLLPAEFIAADRCWPKSTSSGFRITSTREMIIEGIKMIPITDTVQNQAGGRIIQPRRSKRDSADGTRLLLRLSKIFHRDNPESGFFCR